MLPYWFKSSSWSRTEKQLLFVITGWQSSHTNLLFQKFCKSACDILALTCYRTSKSLVLCHPYITIKIDVLYQKYMLIQKKIFFHSNIWIQAVCRNFGRKSTWQSKQETNMLMVLMYMCDIWSLFLLWTPLL